jgi:hypothetical protein
MQGNGVIYMYTPELALLENDDNDNDAAPLLLRAPLGSENGNNDDDDYDDAYLIC